MRHRIFIAINLPEDIKKNLSNYQSGWPELPIRWVKSENLHVTLVFLGYLSDEDLIEVCKIAKEVSQRNKSFLINLKKIGYGPPKKFPPKMVWVEGEKSQELANLKNDLENSLLERIHPGSLEKGRGRPFALHITLGRIRQWEWRKIEPEERPEISKEINLTFEVNSIEVMESELKRGGAEYRVLESVPLIV